MIKREKVDLFYSPYYKIPLLCSCPCVSLLPDVMYLAYKEYWKKTNIVRKAYYLTMGKLFAHRSQVILTRSQFSKKDIIRTYNVAESKVEIIPDSISDAFHGEYEQKAVEDMRAQRNIPEGYALYVGNFKAHKNVKNTYCLDLYLLLTLLVPL